MPLSEGANGVIRGVLHSNAVTLPVYDLDIGRWAFGDLLGLGNLGYTNSLQKDG